MLALSTTVAIALRGWSEYLRHNSEAQFKYPAKYKPLHSEAWAPVELAHH